MQLYLQRNQISVLNEIFFFFLEKQQYLHRFIQDGVIPCVTITTEFLRSVVTNICLLYFYIKHSSLSHTGDLRMQDHLSTETLSNDFNE